MPPGNADEEIGEKHREIQPTAPTISQPSKKGLYRYFRDDALVTLIRVQSPECVSRDAPVVPITSLVSDRFFG